MASPSLVGNSENDWRAQSDMRTLVEAEAIRKDPKRFKAAMNKAKSELASIEGVVSAADDKKTAKK